MTRHNDQQPAYSEQRGQGRIDEEVMFDYRLLSQADISSRLHDMQARPRGQDTLLPQLKAIAAQIASLQQEVRAGAPHAAGQLDELHQQVRHLAQQIGGPSSPVRAQRLANVNLSARGLSFQASQEISPGSLIEIQLASLDAYLTITTYALVVYCQQEGATDQPAPYRVGVELTFLGDAERQALLGYVEQRLSAGEN